MQLTKQKKELNQMNLPRTKPIPKVHQSRKFMLGFVHFHQNCFHHNKIGKQRGDFHLIENNRKDVDVCGKVIVFGLTAYQYFKRISHTNQMNIHILCFESDAFSWHAMI